jgi:outer membrane protein
MKNIVTIVCLILLSSSLILAQDLLTPEQAVEIALKNNYGITISRNQLEIVQNNNTLGNAGFLPSLNANVSGNTSDNSFKQNLSNGTTTERNNVNSNALNAGLALSWTVFDGFKMFATHEKLQTLNRMGEIQLKVDIENAVTSILQTYYEVVLQKQEQKALENSISLYSELVKIAEQKYNVGLTSKVEYLQAKVDLNAIRSLHLQKRTVIDISKSTLNELLGRSTDTSFDVLDSIEIDQTINYEALKSSAEQQNSLIKFNEQNLRANQKTIQEITSSRYPRLSLNFGYNYTRSQSEGGFILLNQTSGPTAGFTATWNLFNGRILNSQIRNARVQMNIASVTLEQSKLNLSARLQQSFANAQLAFEVLQLEEENFLLAKENVTLGLERYRLGSGTQVQINQAYLSYETSQNRLLSARLNAKKAEIELKKLNGELVK